MKQHNNRVGSMDDDNGFKDRVDKVFASISSSSSSSSSSSWSLIITPQVNHHNNTYVDVDVDDRHHVFSSFQTHQTLDDDDIRSSIGLDPSLDYEEEEDAYDKMAQGIETCDDDRFLYMNMKDVGAYLNSHNILPRPNHDARLKEDDNDNAPMLTAQPSQQQHDDPVIIKIKSILKKRKTTYDDDVLKPAKRVSFHSTCKNVVDTTTTTTTHPVVNGRGVPDYILNPSNYTHYTFDDDCSHHTSSNSQEFLEQQVVEEASHKACRELPKSILFIPRKKRDDAGGCNSKKQSSTPPCSTIGIAVQQAEINEMQESHVDDVCTRARCEKKPVRQYRSKMEEDDDDDGGGGS